MSSLTLSPVLSGANGAAEVQLALEGEIIAVAYAQNDQPAPVIAWPVDPQASLLDMLRLYCQRVTEAGSGPGHAVELWIEDRFKRSDLPWPLTPRQMLDAIEALAAKERSAPQLLNLIGPYDQIELLFAADGRQVVRLALLAPSLEGAWYQDLFQRFHAQAALRGDRLLAARSWRRLQSAWQPAQQWENADADPDHASGLDDLARG